jgi:hypothetical protein
LKRKNTRARRCGLTAAQAGCAASATVTAARRLRRRRTGREPECLRNWDRKRHRCADWDRGHAAGQQGLNFAHLSLLYAARRFRWSDWHSAPVKSELRIEAHVV